MGYPAISLPAQQPVAHPRPFATYYYEAVRGADKGWSKVGRAASLRGAARAALGHIIDRKYASCEVYDLHTGICIARLFRKGKQVTVIGV